MSYLSYSGIICDLYCIESLRSLFPCPLYCLSFLLIVIRVREVISSSHLVDDWYPAELLLNYLFLMLMILHQHFRCRPIGLDLILNHFKWGCHLVSKLGIILLIKVSSWLRRFYFRHILVLRFNRLLVANMLLLNL